MLYPCVSMLWRVIPREPSDLSATTAFIPLSSCPLELPRLNALNATKFTVNLGCIRLVLAFFTLIRLPRLILAPPGWLSVFDVGSVGGQTLFEKKCILERHWKCLTDAIMSSATYRHDSNYRWDVMTKILSPSKPSVSGRPFLTSPEVIPLSYLPFLGQTFLYWQDLMPMSSSFGEVSTFWSVRHDTIIETSWRTPPVCPNSPHFTETPTSREDIRLKVQICWSHILRWDFRTVAKTSWWKPQLLAIPDVLLMGHPLVCFSHQDLLVWETSSGRREVVPKEL